MTTTQTRLDRVALVRKHNVHLGVPDARNPLTVGNGDFAFTADATGMQTFTAFHDPDCAEAEQRLAVNTCTMTTWGWHEMPNPRGWQLADAMTEYSSARGPVRYPDKFDMATMMDRRNDDPPAGTWLHVNPQRLDLGRVGLVLHSADGSGVLQDPDQISNLEQSLDLWSGAIRSAFTFDGSPVIVDTVAHPERATAAFRITTPLLAEGRAGVDLRFGYASAQFNQPNDWDANHRHTTGLAATAQHSTIRRILDGTVYSVAVGHGAAEVTKDGPHRVVVTPTNASATFEVVVEWADADTTRPLPSFDDVRHAAASHWEGFWQSGAAIAIDADDPRAAELERRIVLSQYLTAVHCSGTMPPQETGLVTNSWQGKAHLEMHWWHAAHFTTWGRPHLLRRSMQWYRTILPAAQATATGQGYPGARWPKQVGPDGRESPAAIGALLIWQQAHPLYFAELLFRALGDEVVEELQDIVAESAAFMAAFVEERADRFHLPAPLVPAQEFYDAATTEDPTFELAYWWWGLEIANRWRERSGAARNAQWTRIQDELIAPTARDGRYPAIGTAPYLRRDDHPSMLGAFGMVPGTPLISPDVMHVTLVDVLHDWQWDTAWGWDFPMLAMTATRLGEPEIAVDTLLRDAEKNTYLANGHNPQMGNFLPIYLPGNGGLLSAVSLMAAGTDTNPGPIGFPSDWTIYAEGFAPWP